MPLLETYEVHLDDDDIYQEILPMISISFEKRDYYSARILTIIQDVDYTKKSLLSISVSCWFFNFFMLTQWYDGIAENCVIDRTLTEFTRPCTS